MRKAGIPNEIAVGRREEAQVAGTAASEALRESHYRKLNIDKVPLGVSRFNFDYRQDN